MEASIRAMDDRAVEFRAEISYLLASSDTQLSVRQVNEAMAQLRARLYPRRHQEAFRISSKCGAQNTASL